MRLEADLLVGSPVSFELSAMERWPPVQQRRFRIIRASFEFLDGMLRAAYQLYTTNVPPDMRIIRVFGVEPEFIDPQEGQAVGILTILVASAGFEELDAPKIGEPPPEIPEMAVKIMTYYDPRVFLEKSAEEKGDGMKEIGKWGIPIAGAGSFTLLIPENAQFLECRVQGKTPVLWAVVRTTAKEREYKFHVFATGEQFEHHDDLTYIGTFQLVGGAFASHLFVQGAIKL